MSEKKKPAAKKLPPDPKSKLNIVNEMAAFDRKDRDYVKGMTEEERKKFSPFTMIRWGALVADDFPWYVEKNNRESLDPSRVNKAGVDMQAYYLMSCNQKLNKHFFDINAAKHKDLLWLLATTVSPGMGKHYHEWLPAKKEENNSKAERFLAELYPALKSDEIKLLAEVNDTDDLKRLAREHGWDDKRLKSDL
jgi:hypothetical protein